MPRNTRRPLAGIGRRERVVESATTRQPTGSGDLYGLAGYWLRLVSEILDTYTPCRGCKRPRLRAHARRSAEITARGRRGRAGGAWWRRRRPVPDAGWPATRS